MRRILVTGGNGQLGHELRRIAQIETEYAFLFTDVAELDITDPGRLRDCCDANRPDTIINCAAYTAVDRAESEVDRARLINRDAARNCAVEASRTGAALVHVSTDFVFDGTRTIPYVESDAVGPVGIYGQTKLEGEQAVIEACPAACVIRTSWLYSSHGANFVKTMRRLGAERAELGVVFDQVGTPTYAADLARVVMLSVKHGLKGLYHYSNEGVASWYDFAVAIMELSGLSCQVRPIETQEYPTPARRPAFSVLNKKKIRHALGLEIPHWRKSLEACIQQIQREAV